MNNHLAPFLMTLTACILAVTASSSGDIANSSNNHLLGLIVSSERVEASTTMAIDAPLTTGIGFSDSSQTIHPFGLAKDVNWLSSDQAAEWLKKKDENIQKYRTILLADSIYQQKFTD